MSSDPVTQWLDWEEQANLLGFRTDTRPVEVDVVSVPREELEIYPLPDAPASILDRFLHGDRVLVPRHPLNRDPSVSWFDAPVSERWQARFTSSRTLAFPGPESGAALFSLKLATDHPHPDFYQPEKTRLREEALGAVEWLPVLARIDTSLGPPEGLSLVREVLVGLAVGGESGFMVRDLRLFQDGHYYLPALSIPFVGRALAGGEQEFAAFWGRAYASTVGRAKAQLLLRYGLWYDTPNPQNVIVQLDRALRPTGRVVFRDLGDCDCATDALETQGDLPWTRFVDDLRPETRNSFWAFGEAGDLSVGPAVLESWYGLHDDAYFGELERWLPALRPPQARGPEARLSHWNEALRSNRAEAAIAEAWSARVRSTR